MLLTSAERFETTHSHSKHRSLKFNGICFAISQFVLLGNHLSWVLESTLLVFLSGGPEGKSLGNFTPPNHPHQMLITKQGNSPETATASRIRAELRQEENAGWDTQGRKAKTATQHGTNTTQQRPQSLKWWRLKRPQKKATNHSSRWAQASFSLSYSFRAKLPKRWGGGRNNYRNV